MTLAEMERKLASLERRIGRLEARPVMAIGSEAPGIEHPNYRVPPRLSAEVYDPAFWERMEVVA